MFELIGKVRVNFDALVNNLREVLISEKEDKRCMSHMESIWGRQVGYTPEWKPGYEAWKKLFDHWVGFAGYDTALAYAIEKGKELLEPMVEMAQYTPMLDCLYHDDIITIVSAGGEQGTILVPSEYVDTFNPLKDYSSVSGAERRALLTGVSIGGNDKGIAETGLSLGEALDNQKEALSKSDAIRKKIEAINEEKDSELAELKAAVEKAQAELDAKKASMMAEMEAKRAAMEAELEKMELEIFRLDSEIYAIRCYTGEIIEFYPVKSGKSAPEDTPLIAHQKVRYLDEELGKLASIYNVDFSDAKYFEGLLQHNPCAVDVFAPTERSLMLARVSRTGRGFTRAAEYSNLLDMYEKYRGNRIVIILRDGENIYLGWTDEQKISFEDNLFYRPGEVKLDPEAEDSLAKGRYETDDAYERRMKSQARKNASEMISRVFIWQILQGVADRDMIKFPERINVQHSNYVVMSYADGWIEDKKYGEFSDIIEKCNSRIHEGDTILTTQYLTAEGNGTYRSRYAVWTNDRGIGDRNRTHDVHVEDCGVYDINKVVHSAKYHISIREKSGEEKVLDRVLTDDELEPWKARLTVGESYRANYAVTDIKMAEGSSEYSYYVSLLKEYSRSGAARANFEVYPGEFWNLTYMNSVWLEYTITNHRTENIRIGGYRVDFAHLIPYLKTALQEVREREKAVAKTLSGINSDILADTEWPVKLSEYMLEKDLKSFGVRTLRGFAKAWAGKNKAK